MPISAPISIGSAEQPTDLATSVTLETTVEVPINGTAFMVVGWRGSAGGTPTIPGWTLDHYYEGTFFSSASYHTQIARFRRPGGLAEGSEVTATTTGTVHGMGIWGEYVTSDIAVQVDDSAGNQGGDDWSVEVEISEAGIVFGSLIMPNATNANEPTAPWHELHDVDFAGFTRHITVYELVEEAGTYTPAGTTTNGAESAISGVAYVESFGPPPLQMSIELSGGVDNEANAASLGGAVSGTDVPELLLFENVLRLEADAGSVKYRCIYLRNGDLIDVTAIAWIHQQPGETTLAIGVAPEGPGEDAELVADEDTAPADVTFAVIESSLTPLELGQIPPGDAIGIWIRRTVPSGIAGQFVNAFELRFGVETV